MKKIISWSVFVLVVGTAGFFYLQDNSAARNLLAIGHSQTDEQAPNTQQPQPESKTEPSQPPPNQPESQPTESPEVSEPAQPEKPKETPAPLQKPADLQLNQDAVVVSNAQDLTVLVNKQNALPADYIPNDLVKPNVPFSFQGDNPKKQLRKEAAAALEELFAQAQQEHIKLVGVSGYRSYKTQTAIFASNVKAEGLEQANRTSAVPGQSEHQTGLSIDVSSPSVGNALTESLGETREGKWLADNAHKFGFIIRYPEGKEAITGYSYEPWHIRYVGKEIASIIFEQGLTLEEYYESVDSQHKYKM